MVQCLETVKDNIGVNIGVDARRRYAMYGDSDSDGDGDGDSDSDSDSDSDHHVRCFTCLAST